MIAARFVSLAIVAGLAVLAPAACSPAVIDFGTGGGDGGVTEDAGTTNFGTCDGPGQCVLVTKGCCPPCGTPTLSDLRAINVKGEDAFADAVCPVPESCPKCAAEPNPHLFAFCESGTCVGADMRTDPISLCTKQKDCKLRFGSGCCESCSGTSSEVTAIHVNNADDLKSLVCGPLIDCEECVPTYPADVTAQCNEDGHCEAVGFNQP